MLRYFALLIVLFVECQTLEHDSHFTDALSGRMSWVIDSSSLPWTGAYHFLEGETNPTTLLTIVDSSNGVKLGECSAINEANGWRRFFWTLEENSLLCNVSYAEVSKINLPIAGYPRTFSARILAENGPRCFRDIIVQNERQKGCPPVFQRNMYQYAALACECPASSIEKEAALERESPTPNNIAFPIFKLTSTSKEPSTEQKTTTQQIVLPHIARFTNSHIGIANLSNLAGYLHPSTTTPLFSLFTTTAIPSPCDGMECENNGTCVVNFEGEAVCLDVCSTTLCMNGGKCKVVNNEGVCMCPTGTTGKICEQVLCNPPCANNGTCVFINGTASCRCEEGYLGINCNVINSCINKSACAVFGSRARCSIDPDSYSVMSPEPVEASYTCQCLNKNNHWSDCIELYVTSTTISAPSLPAAVMTAVTLPPKTSGPFTESSSVTKSPEMFTINILSGIKPLEHSAVTSDMIPYTETTKETEESLREKVSILPESGETQLPFSFTFAPEFNSNHSIVFPFSVLPSTVAVTTTSTPELLTSEEKTSATFDKGVGQPSVNVLHSFTNISSTSETLSPSSQTSLTKPMQTHEMETTTAAGIDSFETPEITTTESFWEHSTIAIEQTISSRPHWPETTIHPFWPKPTQITTMETEEVVSVETSDGNNAEGKLDVTPMATTVAVSKEVILPSWQEPVVTTEEPTFEWVTSERPLVPDHTLLTEPPPKSIETNEIELETTVAYPTETIAVTSTQGFVVNEVQGSHANLKTGGKTKETAKGSSSSWIVAMVAILTLLMLLGAAGLFVLRYVKRSRKLHGKYNPAREENALSSNYSMPMTTVPKEERLI